MRPLVRDAASSAWSGDFFLSERDDIFAGFRDCAWSGELNFILAGAWLIDLPSLIVLLGLIDMRIHLTDAPYLGSYEALCVSYTGVTLYGVRFARKTLTLRFLAERDSRPSH